MILKFRATIATLVVAFIIFWNGLGLAANLRQYKFVPLDNIVVAGDIHADPLALLNIFLNNHLINADGKWIARNTDIVLMGDIIDRGPDSLHTLDLVIHYKRLAAQNGCRLLVLRGNHDLILFEDDFRYMTKEDRNVFASVGARTNLQIAQLLADPTWPYADELIERQMFYKIGDVGYLHASMDEWAEVFNPDQVNRGFREYTEKNLAGALAGTLGRVPAGGLFSDQGPHYSRLMVEGNLSQEKFEALLANWGIKYLVVGHTVTESNRPETRYNGKLIMVDTGISSGMEGQVWSIRARGDQMQKGQFEATRMVRRNAEASKILTQFKKERKKMRAIHNLSVCGSPATH